MKFAIAVVMLALAFAGVQSSIVPWPLAHAAHIPVATSWAHGPVISHAHHGPVLAHAVHPAAISLSHGPAWSHHGVHVAHHGVHVAHHVPAAVAVHAAPAHAIAVHSAPAHAIAVAAPHHGHDGHYVAKTRGAVHTAPLAGHIASVSSVNVAPAPGTH